MQSPDELPPTPPRLPLLNAEQMYEEFLRQVNADEAQMHPMERIERRRTFFAGVSTLLQIILTQPPEVTDDEIVEYMERLTQEMGHFWNSQVSFRINPN